MHKSRIFSAIFLSLVIIAAGASWIWNPIQKSVKPRLSIITSIWNGDEFIEGFLADITKQTIFPESELILINANSPTQKQHVIDDYLKRYPNIIYIKLAQDPGLYGVWNYGIRKASSDLVANANLDDRSRIDALEEHVKALESDPTIDLVYAGYYITQIPNETFSYNHHQWTSDPEEFSKKNMRLCLPGPRPVWRKSLHDRYGFFDETFVSAADWAMWLRAASLGAKYKKIPGIATLYYLNPTGLSTNADEKKTFQRNLENALIVHRYKHVWEEN